ncbi:hypothetical protein Tco_0883733 [Tanacetum coccineum]
MVAIRLHQPWRAILSVLNRSLMGKDLSWDTVSLPILQILWVESENAKTVDEPEEQHVSPVKSGRGKGFICYGDQVANVPNKPKKDAMPRKTTSLTIAEETVIDDTVVDTYAEWGQKLKGPIVEDLAVQSLLDLQKGSKASRLESLKQKKQSVVGEGSSAAHNKYYDSSVTNSDAILYSLNGYDDAAGNGVFMHTKSTTTPNPTYLSLTVTSSSPDFIQTLLDETPANELMDFMSHPMYTDAQTALVVCNLEGNPELTSYISGASEVPLAFEKSVQAKVLAEIKKLLPTHILKAVESYVRPRLNTSVLEDSPNNREGENKKRRKDVGEPSSRSSRRDKSPMKSGSSNAMRKTTWFDLLLKSDINQNENHIHGPSTVAIAKKLKAIIQKDELTIVYLEGKGLKRLKQQYKNDVELKYHVDQHKAAVLTKSKWNNDEDEVTEEKYTTSITKHYASKYYKKGIEDMISDRWSKETHRYIFEALNGIHHWEDSIIDFFKEEMSTRTEGIIYLDLRIKSFVRVVVKKKWGYGF